VPASSRKGKRLHLARFALRRQRLALKFKIESANVASSENDLLSGPDTFFGKGSEGFLRGHFAVDSN